MYKSAYRVSNRWIPVYVNRRYYPKTWWNSDCKRAWSEREKAYKCGKVLAPLVTRSFGKNRAKFTRLVKIVKKEDMKKYLSTMTVNTLPSKIYEKLRQLRGREPRKIHIVQSGRGGRW